jgi:hypothetical protein
MFILTNITDKNKNRKFRAKTYYFVLKIKRLNIAESKNTYILHVCMNIVI